MPLPRRSGSAAFVRIALLDGVEYFDWYNRLVLSFSNAPFRAGLEGPAAYSRELVFERLMHAADDEAHVNHVVQNAADTVLR